MKGNNMSIKGIGGPGFRPLESAKSTKRNQNARFDKDMKKAAQVTDKAEIGGNNLKPAQASGYSPVALNAKKPAASAVVQKVMESPEQISSRVDEIKKMIENGGVESYFASVDSEKVAEKLLDSGLLDDLV
jgi:anti-sigma28 factor (negative regulator of flagellin synthesis)